MSEPVDRDTGLSIERTALAWNRTALAALVGGVLAVVRVERGIGPRVGITLLAASLVVAAGASGHAVRLGRRARLSSRTSSRAAILALGVALVALSLGTAAAIAASALT